MNILADIGVIIILATFGGFIARFFKQPLIPSYIITGIIIGPILGLIKNMAVVDVLSEIGIAFLLFIVGIELDLKRLKDVGSVASFGAILQMGISFFIGFIVFILLGFTGTEGIYAGIIIMFSSTMVIIKLLADKSQLDTLHGRILIGKLLMQDVVAVILLSVLNHLGHFNVGILLLSVFEGVLAFVLALFFSKFLFPQLFRFAAKSQELFFLLSIAVCFSFSLLFAKIGFSIAIGAFVGGLMLGNLPYNVEIISKVKGLRDFFATLFFVSMGIKLTFSTLANFTVPFIVLLLLIVIVTPLISFFLTMFFGYGRRVAFLVAISLTQVSEFALIAVQQGFVMGQVSEGFLSLTIIVALFSILITAYLIKYEDWLYRRLLPLLKLADRFFKKKHHFDHTLVKDTHDVLLIGYDRIGYAVYNTLKKQKKDVLIVDFNPDIIRQLMSRGVACLYGDIGDVEIMEKMRLDKVKLVVSTVPNHNDTMLLIKRIRRVNHSARIIVTSYVVDDALDLYEEGADYVILPHLLGGHYAGLLLENVSNDLDKLISTKLAHISELKAHKNRHHNNFKHSFSHMEKIE